MRKDKEWGFDGSDDAPDYDDSGIDSSNPKILPEERPYLENYEKYYKGN